MGFAEDAKLLNEVAIRARTSPVFARLVEMRNGGWFVGGRLRSETVAMVRTGRLSSVSIEEVLNELEWLRSTGLLGAKPSGLQAVRGSRN